MLNPIFSPGLNYIVRHLVKPFARWIPQDWRPRVTGTIRLKVDNRRTVFLNCNPTTFMGKCLFYQGMEGWEPATTAVLMRLLRQSEVFVDVGANIGYFTALAKKCHPAVHVISVEPAPGAFLYLQKNVRLNRLNGVALVNKALAESSGRETFHLSIDPTFKDVSHHLTATAGLNEHFSRRSPIMRSFDVETVTLDELVREAAPEQSIDVIKTDTEAAEHRVLRGGHRVLSEHRPAIVCEVLPDTIEKELEALLSAYDYRATRIRRSGLEEVESLGGHTEAERQHLFVPAERVAETMAMLMAE